MTVAVWVRPDTFTGTHREFVTKGGFARRLRYRPDISKASFKCTAIYDARVYNRALCPDEISYLYGTGFTGIKIIKWEEIQ